MILRKIADEVLKHELPCMYGGRRMLSRKTIIGLNNKNAFSGPIQGVVETLTPFKDCLQLPEVHLFGMIENAAERHPRMNLSRFFKGEQPLFEKELKSQQYNVLDILDRVSLKLPPRMKHDFDKLLQVTYDKIEGKSIVQPFYRGDFKSRFIRLLEYRMEDKKTIGFFNSVIDEFPHYKEPDAQARQLECLNKIRSLTEQVWKSKKLPKSQDLTDLFDISERRINLEPIFQPFSNKTFMYDLDILLDGYNNNGIKNHLLGIARQLPNSRTTFSARMVKLANKTSNAIGMELLEPSTATIEHLKPRSYGGKNNNSNYGIASMYFNNIRNFSPLYSFLSSNPGASQNIQKYFDRLIDLYNGKMLGNLSDIHSWIVGSARTIYNETEGIFAPNISRLKNMLKNVNFSDISS